MRTCHPSMPSYLSVSTVTVLSLCGGASIRLERNFIHFNFVDYRILEQRTVPDLQAYSLANKRSGGKAQLNFNCRLCRVSFIGYYNRTPITMKPCASSIPTILHGHSKSSAELELSPIELCWFTSDFHVTGKVILQREHCFDTSVLIVGRSRVRFPLTRIKFCGKMNDND